MANFTVREKLVPKAEVFSKNNEIVYSGYSKSLNRFLFLISGKKFVGHGHLQQVVGAAHGKKILLSIKRTLTDVNEISNCKYFSCLSKDALVKYRFTGVFKECKQKDSQNPAVGKAQENTEVNLQVAISSLVAEEKSSAKTIREIGQELFTKCDPSLEYQMELVRIGMARNEGLDISVRMGFISWHLGESRANLYNKMKQKPALFPSPTKRGRGSYWSFEEIEKYRKGEWVSQTIKSNPPGTV